MKRFITGVAVFAMMSGMAFAAEDGAAIFKAKCAMCHGATGAGDTPAGKSMKVLPFAKMAEADMVTIITNGKGKMPAYKGKLTDAQINEVAAYSHSLIK